MVPTSCFHPGGYYTQAILLTHFIVFFKHLINTPIHFSPHYRFPNANLFLFKSWCTVFPYIVFLIWSLGFCTSLYFVPWKEDEKQARGRHGDRDKEERKERRMERGREGGVEVKCWSQYHRVNISAGGRGWTSFFSHCLFCLSSLPLSLFHTYTEYFVIKLIYKHYTKIINHRMPVLLKNAGQK